MTSSSWSAVAAALFLAACTSTAKIDTRIRPGYSKKIHDVYVEMISASADVTPFLEQLDSALTDRFGSRGIRTRVAVVDSVAMRDTAELRRELAAFEPAFVLEVGQTGSATMAGHLAGGSFDLILYEAGNENAVWKGVLETSREGINMLARGKRGAGVGSVDKTADAIVSALEQDGLLPAPVRTN